MREFFQQVKSSIYDQAYYRGLLGKSMGPSFRYFFTFTFCVALICTVLYSFFTIPLAKQGFNWLIGQTEDIYPAELEVKLDHGIVSTNVTEPYSIKIPDNQKKDINQDGRDFDNYLVIDTKTPFSVDEFKNYKTLVLLTRDTVVYNKEKAISIQSLDEIPNVTVNKNNVNDWLGRAKKLEKVIPPLVVLGTFVGLFCWNLLSLFYLALASLIVWLFFWWWGVAGGYKKAFQVGLHAITLPTLVRFAIFLVFPSTFSWLFDLLFLTIIFANLKMRTSTPKVSS